MQRDMRLVVNTVTKTEESKHFIVLHGVICSAMILSHNQKD